MFRFTIRDVLWLTALIAIGAAWGIRETQLRRKIAWLQLAIDREGYEVLEDQFGPFIMQTKDRLDSAEVLGRNPDGP